LKSALLGIGLLAAATTAAAQSYYPYYYSGYPTYSYPYAYSYYGWPYSYNGWPTYYGAPAYRAAPAYSDPYVGLRPYSDGVGPSEYTWWLLIARNQRHDPGASPRPSGSARD
jgi:hypothetical protein